jgi:hypothetical protein
MGKPLVPFMAGIIVDLDTIVIQDRLPVPAIFKTMQVDADACPMEPPDLMKKVKDTPVIHRVGYVQTYNMKVFVFHVVIN